MNTRPNKRTIFHLAARMLSGARRMAIALLVMMLTTPAGAQDPSWLQWGDTWDATTKTLTVNTNIDNDEQPYAGRTEIEHLVIANNITYICAYAFLDCTNLKTVSFAEGSQLRIIYNSVFQNCSSLEAITIPASVTKLGYMVFADCSSLTTIEVAEGNTNFKCENGMLMTQDGTRIIACTNLTNLTSISIPASVTNCSGAFAGCSNLTTVEVAEGNTAYKSENGLLMNMSGTSLVCCPAKWVTGDYTIPNGVKTISSFAFAGCKGLTSVTIPSSVSSISDNAFSGCTNLTTVNFEDGSQLEKIEIRTFKNCTSLTSISIPASVEFIVDQVFENCSSLTTIHIPASVTCVYSSAFKGCSGLTSLTVDEGNTEYQSVNGVLMSKDGDYLVCYPHGLTATSYTVPSGTKYIYSYCFQGCTALKSVTLPESLSTIENNAFEGCSGLTSITIPPSVQKGPGIGSFKDCTNLVTVIDMSVRNNDSGNDRYYYISKVYENVSSSCHFYVRDKLYIKDYDTYENSITIVSGIKTKAGAKATPTTSVEPIFSSDGTDYYTPGTVVTISHGDTAPIGYKEGFKGYEVSNNSNTITDDVFSLTLSEGTVTVKALYDIITYKITFDPNGGTFVFETIDYNVESFLFFDNHTGTPYKSFYDFLGWTGPGYDEPSEKVIIPIGSYGDRTYTANWRLTEYSLTYDLAGGTLPSGVTNPATYNYETETFTLNNPTREGYYFMGWTGSNGYTPQETVAIAQGEYYPKSYTANWAYLLTEITDANVSEIAGKPVALQRTFIKGKPSTICLPFAPTALLGEGSVWEFTGISADHKAVMTQRTNGLQANTPYIFIPASSFEGTIWATAVSSIDLDPKTTDATTGFTFHGTYSNKHWDADDSEVVNGTIYGFMAEDNDGQQVGQFVKARRATNLRAFSCYLEYNGELTGTQISNTRGEAGLPDVIDIVWLSADGDATGISDMKTMRNEENEIWYSLDGRRLSGKPSMKGIYIHNGRKEVVR